MREASPLVIWSGIFLRIVSRLSRVCVCVFVFADGFLFCKSEEPTLMLMLWSLNTPILHTYPATATTTATATATAPFKLHIVHVHVHLFEPR